jgi:hypothetical protein
MPSNKKRYRIYCHDCAAQREGTSILDEPPDECPVNPAHSVRVDSKAILEVISLDNLTATTDPTVNDDITQGYAVESKWINTESGDSFVLIDPAPGAAVWNKSSPVPPNSDFGTFRISEESVDENQTSSTSFQRKARLLAESIPAGVYHIGWAACVRSNQGSKVYAVRVLLDGSTELAYQENYNPAYMMFAGSANISLGIGDHTIDLDFKRVDGVAYIKNARLEFWRVG